MVTYKDLGLEGKGNLKVSILGGGSWGATIASHIAKKGFSVSLWEYFEPQAREMRERRTLSFLPQLKIPQSVLITSQIEEVLSEAEIIFSVVPSQFVRKVWGAVSKFSPPVKLILSFTKGIETESLKRMTEVIIEEFPQSKDKIVVVSGPSHAEEVSQEVPTAVVAAARERRLAEIAQEILGTPTFRVYTSPDVIGVEVCGALKNIFAIACGACSGLGLGDNTQSALLTRGLNEMVKLGIRMGGKQDTFYGLAGMGDLVVTCFSKHSRNRTLGEKIGQGKEVGSALKEMVMVAEGLPTSKSAYQLVKKFGCDCPIITEIYRVLYEGKNILESLHDLLIRPVHVESEGLDWK